MANESARMCPTVESLPDGWQVKRLASFCTKIGSGATPRGGSEVYLDSRISHALVRSQNVFDRRFDSAGLAFISNQHARELRNAEVQSGDILLNITGDGVTFGRACIVPDSILPACVNQHVSIIRPDDFECDPGYLLSVLTHPASKGYIESFNAGGSRRAITKGHIESFGVALPPLPQQQAIAQILGALDDKIELNRRMNATLEAMARVLFQSWFVDFDPVHAKAAGRQPAGVDEVTAPLFPDSFQGSELGEIPEGWKTVDLGSVLDVLETGRRPKGGVSKFLSGVPSIGAESIWGIGEFEFGTTKFVPKEFFDKMNSGKVRHLDVLLYKDGGKPGEFRPRVGMFGHGFPFAEFGINEHVFRLRSLELGQYYLYFALADPRVLFDLANKGGKAAIPGINQNDVRSVKILRPPSPLLTKFHLGVESQITKILWNSKESRTLERLRGTLLPKLLSGELSVTSILDKAEVA